MDSYPSSLIPDDVNNPFIGEFADFVNYDPCNTSHFVPDEPWTAPDATSEEPPQAQPLETTLLDLALPDFELPELAAGSPYPTILDLQDSAQVAAGGVAAELCATNDFNARLNHQVLSSQQPSEFDALIASLDDYLETATALEVDHCATDISGLPALDLAVPPNTLTPSREPEPSATQPYEHLLEKGHDANDFNDHVLHTAHNAQLPSPSSSARHDSPSRKGATARLHRDIKDATAIRTTVELEEEQTNHETNSSHGRNSSRGNKWTADEDKLLLELRGQARDWEHIATHFPYRSSISCRLRYQIYLDKRAVWDEEKKNKFARLYARFKDQMWQKVATEMGIPWRSAELMHWELGEAEMTARAMAPMHHGVFQGSSEVAKRRRSSPGTAEGDHELKLGRASISPVVQEVLEAHFKINPYVDQHVLDVLPTATGLSAKQVRTWYANARYRKAAASGEASDTVLPRGSPMDGYAPRYSGGMDINLFSEPIQGNDYAPPRSSSLARSDTSMLSLGSAMSCSSFRSTDHRGPRRGRKGWTAPSQNFVVGSPSFHTPEDLQATGVNEKDNTSNPESTSREEGLSRRKADYERARRERIVQARAARLFFCTWPGCNEKFHHRSAWARHEEASHYCPYHWVCGSDHSSMPQTDFATCIVCGMHDVSYRHILTHTEFLKCWVKDRESRTFFRYDHLVQHIKGTHVKTSVCPFDSVRSLASTWRTDNPSLPLMARHCGFCNATFVSWKDRQNHVFAHFKDKSSGRRVEKSDWKCLELMT